MLAASIVPAAEPAPIMVWISSMKMMTSGCFCNSIIMARMRSSNCPRYFVPATTAPRSSTTTRLPHRAREMRCSTMRCASPSTMALFPTPGSPMRMGLFFLRRERICATRSISCSRPTTGSSRCCDAAFVRSVPNLSSTGVWSPSLSSSLTFVLLSPLSSSPSSASSSSSSAKPYPSCTSRSGNSVCEKFWYVTFCSANAFAASFSASRKIPSRR